MPLGANYLAHSRDYVDIPSIETVREWFSIIGYSGTIKATCTLKKGLLPLRWRSLVAQIIQYLEGKTGGFDQISNKDVIILYCLATGVNIDFAKLIWDDIVSELKEKNKEKVIPYPRFLSLLLEHKMEGCGTDELEAPNTYSYTKNNDSKGKKPGAKTRQRKKSTPLTMHNPFVKSASHSEPVYSASTIVYSESALGHDASTDSTAEVDPGIDKGTHNYSIDHIIASTNPNVFVDKAKSVKNGLETAHTKTGTKKEASYDQDEFNTSLDLTSSDDAIKRSSWRICQRLFNEVEVHAKAHTKTEDTLVPRPPSPRSIKIQELTSQVLILQSHNIKLEKAKDVAEAEATLFKFQPSYPNLKELPSKFSDISGEYMDLKKCIEGLEIEIPGDLKEIPEKLNAFQSVVSRQVSSITAQLSKLKVLDALPSLLSKVTEALSRFATVIASASLTTGGTNVPLVGQAGTHPAEGEKNTKQATITQPPLNLKGELVKKKCKEVMSHKEVEEKECESDSESAVRLLGSIVESSKQMSLKNFAFVNEQGESFLMTEEEIENQKKVDQDIKVDVAKKKVELGRE
ncbi:hypothetical protein Tco_0057853 [Tanacetum coccineum]